MRAAWLRSFVGGRLKVRPTPFGVMLPLNDGSLSNANPVGRPATSLVVAGDERLYQETRRIVGAEMQVITYEEFLPALLGHPMPRYNGYRSWMNAGLSNVFATAAYRFGHSQVGPDIDVIDSSFEEVGVVELADAFFNPDVSRRVRSGRPG